MTLITTPSRKLYIIDANSMRRVWVTNLKKKSGFIRLLIHIVAYIEVRISWLPIMRDRTYFLSACFCLLVGHYSELAGDAILSTEPGIKRRPRLGHKEDCKQGQKLFHFNWTAKALNHLISLNNATRLQAT